MTETYAAASFEPEDEVSLACFDMLDLLIDKRSYTVNSVLPNLTNVHMLAGHYNLGSDGHNSARKFIITKTAHILDEAPSFIFTRINPDSTRDSIFYSLLPDAREPDQSEITHEEVRQIMQFVGKSYDPVLAEQELTDFMVKRRQAEHGLGETGIHGTD